MRYSQLLVLLLSLQACLAWGVDLPANPGFEQLDPASQLPADWSARTQVGFQGVSREAHSGQVAAAVTIPPGAENPTGYYYSRPAPLGPSRRLTVSVWTRVEATQGGAYLKLYYLSGEKYDTYSGQQRQSETLQNTGGQWRQLVISDAPPADATGWRMSVEFSGAGTALFDDAAAMMDPLEVLASVTLTTPAGKALDLGDGRRGLLGPVTKPSPDQRVVATLQGMSALPRVAQVGLVWFQDAGQLGVVTVEAMAWQTPSETAVPVRPLPGADRFRPIAFTASAADWGALTVTGLKAEVTPASAVAPVGLTPAPHPRLFVTAAELQHLRELLNNDPPAPLAQGYKELMATADACFGEKEIVAYGKYRIPLPPAVPPRHKDVFPYWTGLSRALEIRIEALSTAYLLTGERKYADLAKTWMLAICDWPQWTDPDLDITDACLDTGHFCYAAAFTYDFCYDALTEAERVKLRRTMLDKGAQAVMRAGETGWAKTMSWPNGFAVVMGGMGIVGMATLGDDEGADRYVQYARRRLYEFLSAQDRDGGYVEGLLYGGYAISFTVPFAASLANHGDPVLASHPYLAKTLRMAIYCLAPDGATSVNFCDASSSSRDYAALAAWQARHGDGLGLWYLQTSGHLAKLYDWTPPLGVLWYPDQARLVTPDSLPAAAAYRDIGWAVLRSGFGPDDFLLAFRSGYLGSHCHPDANSFMLNGGGQWLLRDPGYGVVPTSEHSTLLANGAGQVTTGARLTAFGSVGDVVYAAGDATPCYAGLKRFVRHVMMVDHRYVLVVDEVAADGAQVPVTSQFVTSLADPKVSEGRLVELSAAKGYYLTALTPDALTISKGEGPKKLSLTYDVGTDTRLMAYLISKAEGGREPASVECNGDDKAVCLTLRYGTKVDRLFLNVTDRSATQGELTSDARVTLVREDQGKVVKIAVVWGSQVRLAGQEILRKPTRGDYATGR